MAQDHGSAKAVLEMMKKKQVPLPEPARKSSRLEKATAKPSDVSS